MRNITEDEKRLDAIERYFENHRDDCLLDTAEVEFLIDAAYDGMKWRKAAAARDEFAAAWAGFGTFSGAQSVSLECAIKAAAAWRAAHGDDVEALKARVAELEKEKREAFDLGFKAAGGKITPLDHLLPSRMNQ